MAKRRAKTFNGYTPGVEAFVHAGPHARPCDWPGCTGVGEHRAPKSRDQLDAYNWFCLEHIRLYNEAWNYYEGMSAEQVEAEIRRDTVGRRPTWPFGTRSAAFGFTHRRGGDPFGLFEDGPEAAADEAPPRQAVHNTAEAEALIVLDLTPPVTTAAVKARYKQLVKRHHPDVNGGNKASEEMFKRINHAYHLLMQCLAP